MKTHIIMDRRGDTRHEFDATCPVALAEAEARFLDLTGKGFCAVELEGTANTLWCEGLIPRSKKHYSYPSL